MPSSSRTLALFLFVSIAFVTVGRPPGAVQLRTREIEALIRSEGKAERDLKMKLTWIERRAGLRIG